jgi:hypothetical protein
VRVHHAPLCDPDETTSWPPLTPDKLADRLGSEPTVETDVEDQQGETT